MENRDTFGLDATGYRDFRPRYPGELFEFLAALAPDREEALDCGTGTGQAAADLALFFRRVVAIDPSPAQVAAAVAQPGVEYRVAPSEKLPFAADRFSLVTAAQAAHWFRLPEFYREVERVGKRGCVVAIWGYSYCRVSPPIDAIVAAVLLERIEPFWAEGNKVIRDRYRTLDFPFAELPWPGFSTVNAWMRHEYMQYLRTWSAVRKYTERHHVDPVLELESALASVWPDGKSVAVAFDLVGRVGRTA